MNRSSGASRFIRSYRSAAASGAGLAVLLLAALLTGAAWIAQGGTRALIPGLVLYILLLSPLAAGRRRR